MPDNKSGSKCAVRRAAGGDNPVTDYGVIFHEEKLVRAKPRIISPGTVALGISAGAVIREETLSVPLCVYSVGIHDTIAPASHAYGSVINLIKEAMVDRQRVVWSVVSGDELNHPALVRDRRG